MTGALPEPTRLLLAERFANEALRSGPAAAAARVHGVAQARAAQDSHALRSELFELAAAAPAWADAIEADVRDRQRDPAAAKRWRVSVLPEFSGFVAVLKAPRVDRRVGVRGFALGTMTMLRAHGRGPRAQR